MEEVKKRRGRKPKEGKTVYYFNEEDFRSNILPLIGTGKQLPDSFVTDIFAITDGMINTEFHSNTYVLENRDELKQECFYEVLKSLSKFRCEKGRSFAYFNRIIKNTLLKFYYKHQRVSAKEMKILDITKDMENDEEISMDEAFTIVNDKIKVDEPSTAHNSKIFYPSFDIDLSKENKKAKRNQSNYLIEYSLYRYLLQLTSLIDSLFSDKKKMTEFISSSKYFDDEYLLEIGEQNVFPLLSEIRGLFSNCVESLRSRMDEIPENYIDLSKSSIFINNKVLIYVKNEISNKKMRKDYKRITSNPKTASHLVMTLIDFLSD